MNRNGSELVPAWARRTRGEHRWPAAVAVAGTIGLQLLMPAEVVPEGRYVLPALELAVLVGLLVVNPFRVDRESTVLRTAGLVLTGLVALANGWSVVLLVSDLLTGRPATPAELLGAGGAIWLTNVLAFGLVYWELDRGGPAARAVAAHDRPDFLFPQMQIPEIAGRDWEPGFVDYAYLSFTNATAFSPTDVLPLSRWAKLTMAVQAGVSLVVVVLVVARAINALG
ncbi:hypothetical protein K1T35_12070 [Pseudonocardia sp. DSM 110487]|uniref:hypothetical protein n=1 Tax=Pseudonocardia sp. DSM 110487 TaxID=2865833 RepID=UPI001C69B155|nr:hypothetical protein [Pseudonocardia sp. DSM 110487]QYN37906.1 hypothetical protein K1T35_12070 [Pseudonocardia sp. DSM 110487]